MLARPIYCIDLEQEIAAVLYRTVAQAFGVRVSDLPAQAGKGKRLDSHTRIHAEVAASSPGTESQIKLTPASAISTKTSHRTVRGDNYCRTSISP